MSAHVLTCSSMLHLFIIIFKKLENLYHIFSGFSLNILFYNISNCETNFSTALERIQNLVQNNLSSDKDFYFCYRNIRSERQLVDN